MSNAGIQLKYMGYVLGTAAPETSPDFNDFVNFCKFKLCVVTGTLQKDPIWDEYTPEEIIIEYYAHQFQNDTYRKNYESGDLADDSDSFSDWVDSQIEKDTKSENVKVDKISFNPSEVM